MLGILLELIFDIDFDPNRDPRQVRVTNARLDAFNAGRVVRVRCRVRWPDAQRARWRRGRLYVTRGRADWRQRFRRRRSLTIDRRAIAESARVRSRMIVLVCLVEGVRVELAVRWRDLPLVGRVVALPSLPMTAVRAGGAPRRR